MANFTAADIKALRESTGAGMLDVRKALEEAEGDLVKATEIIRVKGLKGVAKRGDREATDGLVAIKVRDGGAGQIGTLIELNSETDFVAKNEKFLELADKVLTQAVATDATDAESLLASEVEPGKTLQLAIDEAAATLGERIVVRRVVRVEGASIASYLHRTAKDLPPTIGVMVVTDAAGAAVGHDIATHVAAFDPPFMTRDDVPAEKVADERRIQEETTRAEGKPEAMVAKIAEARMNGFYKEVVLVDQPFAKDPKKSVGQILSEAGGEILSFVRVRVGN